MLQNIPAGEHGNGALHDQAVRRGAQRRIDAARHGEHVAIVVERIVDGDHRAGFFRALHDQHALAQPADDAVAGREIAGRGARAGRIFGNDRAAVIQYAPVQRLIFLRIDHVCAAAKHRHSPAHADQRALVGGGVHAVGHAADNGHVLPRQRFSDLAGGALAVARTAARADDGEVSLAVQRTLTQHVQRGRRIKYRGQLGRIGVAQARQCAHAVLFNAGEQIIEILFAARGLQRAQRGAAQKAHLFIAHIVPYGAGVLIDADELVEAPRADAIHA